ncbi:hypothetical protein BP5796_11965 [Coleophoma crateriformis]|uniref:Major facilitator superfamily (MFS) profile domain-containing protein n=1 Tax=Coleophoma crateriformis TaxID=565419 RepID=A0A3D8QBC6_9HELO|nr:hypothetical protein BP5796_11965 [Coleophoma crateriformis]
MTQSIEATQHGFLPANGTVKLVPLHKNPREDEPESSELHSLPQIPSLVEESEGGRLPKGQLIITVATLTGVNFISSLSTGLLTVGLPRMAADVELAEHLLLWPSSVYALTSGSCLLLAGSIADVVGNRIVNLVGCLTVGCFILACGLARTGIELIMFRALQGIAVSLCLPTSVAIVANALPSGRARNIGFSCLGLVQPIGFSMGLILAGVFLDTVGWRFGYFLCGGLTLVLFFLSIWALPPDKVMEASILTRLKTEIDWIGAIIACASLSLLSYVLANLTNDVSNIRRPSNLVVLIVSIALMPSFIYWENRQEQRERPMLIPNFLWKNKVFTSICLMVLSSFAVLNSMEMFCSLFFQEVQNLSALQASLRILPSLIVGAILQMATGLLIDRISAFYLVVGSLVLSAGAPLLMAVIHVQWPYWYDAFFAQLLTPISADILFTVGLLVVSEVFPAHTQALAGAVFNTVAQFGNSIGLTVMAIISSSATKRSSITDKSSPSALMVGYRASFWAAFVWMIVACVVGSFGLRRMGKVGIKRD